MTGKTGRSGGTRTGAGRPPSDPALRQLWQLTGLRGPALTKAALDYVLANVDEFAGWLESSRVGAGLWSISEAQYEAIEAGKMRALVLAGAHDVKLAGKTLTCTTGDTIRIVVTGAFKPQKWALVKREIARQQQHLRDLKPDDIVTVVEFEVIEYR